MKAFGILVLAALFQSTAVFGQGNLTPPGAPAPTMKTLEQIEPRTRIGSVPYVITAPGSYYLDGNLTNNINPGLATIRVLSDHVTIDLGGFSLVGLDAGILLPPEAQSVTVKNGVIRNHSIGINGAARGTVVQGVRFMNNGSGMSLGSAAVVEQCTLISNANFGLLAGPGSQVRNCLATANGSYGFTLGEGSTISDCVASFSSDGFVVGNSVVVNCAAYTNSSRGFNASQGAQFVNCAAVGNGLIGFSGNGEINIAKCVARGNGDCGVALLKVLGTETTSIIRDSLLTANVNYGLLAQARVAVYNSTADFNRRTGMQFQEPATVIGCTAVSNRSSGFSASAGGLVQDCTATRNGNSGIFGDAGTRVIGCLTSSNGLDGISVRAGSTVVNCTARGNGDDGIDIANDCFVSDNHCSGNGSSAATSGAGIHASQPGNRIEGNHSVQNEIGYRLDGDGSTLFRNTARGNGTNWVIAAGNDVGPIGNAAGSTSPFANIEF